MPRLPAAFTFMEVMRRSKNRSSSRSSRPSRKDINAAAPKDTRKTVAGAGAIIPLHYGQVRTGPLLARAVVYQTRLVLHLIWGIGEWDEIEELLIGGEPAGNLVTATHYLGTSGQGVDPTLAAAIPGWDNTLVKVINGQTVALTYSVIQVSAGKVQGFPEFEVIARTKKVLPSTGTGPTVFSRNPSLIMADFESSTVYGRGRTVDYTTVSTLEAAADETLSDGSKRMQCDLTFNRQVPSASITQALRAYASTFYRIYAGVVKFVPDRPSSSLGDITRANIIMRDGDPQFWPELISSRDQPTSVQVRYTDKSISPWVDGVAEAVHPDVNTGLVQRREAVFDMPGIPSHAQAYRWAVERLNGYYLRDFKARMVVDDSALAWEVGDVRRLNFSPSIRGVTIKLVRILSIGEDDPGRHTVEVEEYDPAVYSDSIAEGPTYPDTTLPSPFNPFPPSSAVMTEELYVDQTGTTHSRMRVSWDGIDWPFVTDYRVTVSEAKSILDTEVIHRGSAVAHEVVTPSVRQGIQYTANVYTISSTGDVSDTYAIDTKTALGKFLRPSDVMSITGFEVGQIVFLKWDPAIDFDLAGYQLRRGLTTDTWETATIIVARIDALNHPDPAVPAGTHRYFVKALDSTQQESVNAAFVDITVTQDVADTGLSATTFINSLVETYQNFHFYRLNGVGSFAVTSFHETWSERFGIAGTPWSDSTAKPWCLDHPDSDNSYIQYGEWDQGSDRTGRWTISPQIELIQHGAGVPGSLEFIYLATAADYPTFTQYVTRSTVKPGRYMKPRIKDNRDGPDAAIKVRFPLQGSFQGQQTDQSGTASIPASGQPLTVTFSPAFAGAPKLQKLIVIGSSPRTVTADLITATTMKLYAWDQTWTPAATTVEWAVRGA